MLGKLVELAEYVVGLVGEQHGYGGERSTGKLDPVFELRARIEVCQRAVPNLVERLQD